MRRAGLRSLADDSVLGHQGEGRGTPTTVTAPKPPSPRRTKNNEANRCKQVQTPSPNDQVQKFFILVVFSCLLYSCFLFFSFYMFLYLMFICFICLYGFMCLCFVSWLYMFGFLFVILCFISFKYIWAFCNRKYKTRKNKFFILGRFSLCSHCNSRCFLNPMNQFKKKQEHKTN